MTIQVPDDQYVEYVQLRRERDAQKQQPRDGLLTKVFIVVVMFLLSLMVADHFHLIPPALVDKIVGTPQATFSTPPQNSPANAPQRPAPAPEGQGGALPWPTLTPEPERATPTATATATPAPTAFWTEEERAAFTATAEAWYDPSTLPTAPPEFAAYVDERCKDAGAVEESATLQLFCKK